MEHPPDPALPLLWRHRSAVVEAGTRRGPKQKLTLDELVDAAIELADREGLEAVSMRPLAQRLGLGAMSLYTYVPGRQELLTLMVDQALGRTELPPHADDLRTRLATLAELQYADYLAHPWLLEVGGRPWLGPHSSDRYEWQLAAVEGIGLDDVEMDQAVTLLVSFAAGVARSVQAVRRAERESGLSDADWWAANADALAELIDGSAYPIAGRVGTSAGETYQAASDQAREFEFGLARILDGLLAYLDRRTG